MSNSSTGCHTEIIDVYIRPNSCKNMVEGFFGNRIKIRIACTPEKGKANKALVDFIASKTGIPKTFIKILSGHKSIYKTVSVKDLEGRNIIGLLTEGNGR